MSTRKSLALFGALAALAFAGCGGDGDGDGGGPLSTDDYETEAGAALEPVSESDIGQAASEATTPEELAAATNDVGEIYDTAISDLEAIEPPEAVADAHEQLVAALQAFNEALAAVGDAAEADDKAAIQQAAVDLQGALPDFQAEITDAQAQFSEEDIQLDLVPAP